MKFENIKAQIITDWNHPNCKLLPGDRAQVANFMKCNMSEYTLRTNSYYSDNLFKRSGSIGTVVAVSSADGVNIRVPSRCYTKYYLKFDDGDCHGFLSGHLTKVSEVETWVIPPNSYINLKNVGLAYSTWPQMAEKMKLVNYVENASPKQGVYRIIASDVHPTSGAKIVGILETNTGQSYIVNANAGEILKMEEIKSAKTDMQLLEERVKILEIGNTSLRQRLAKKDALLRNVKRHLEDLASIVNAELNNG